MMASLKIILMFVCFYQVKLQDTAEETQHAICKVMTQDIQTSANATIKRQLKGICTSTQIDRKFKQLERKLLQELNEIKALLSNEKATVKSQDYDYFNYDEKSLDGNVESVTELLMQESFWSRREIEQFNNSIYIQKGEKLYSYYWKIPQIEDLLVKDNLKLKSNFFKLLDQQFYLELYPKYLNSNYLAVNLFSHVAKKHRFTILDQLDPTKDLISQVFTGLGSAIYRVPYAKLQERNYLSNNTILVKVTIYLNS